MYDFVFFLIVGNETDRYQRFVLCEFYTVLHPCKEHESCVLEKNTPVCRYVFEMTLFWYKSD